MKSTPSQHPTPANGPLRFLTRFRRPSAAPKARSPRPPQDDAPVSGARILGRMVILSIGVTAAVAVCGTALLTALAAVAWLAL